MITEKICNQYKLQCISVDKNNLPIDLDTVRHHVGASFTEDDNVISNVIIKACEQVEIMTYKSILNRTWELTHCRSDIILKMPPIRDIVSVFYKGTKKWCKIPLELIQETFINDGERRIVVPNFRTNQMVRVIYTAGSKMYYNNEIDHRFAMPYSTSQLLLKLCTMYYTKIKTQTLDEQINLISMCQSYCSSWNDPIF